MHYSKLISLTNEIRYITTKVKQILLDTALLNN